MTEQKTTLCKALKQCMWGYFFLYFNINLNTIDLLPSWVGYLLFYQAIKTGLPQHERSAGLLKPLAIGLGIYQFLSWIINIFNIAIDFNILDDIIAVIALYFQFQLLTNLAGIAGKYHCPHQKSLLTLRNIQTILTTVMLFVLHFDSYGFLLFLLVVQLIVGICIFIEVRSLRITMEQMTEDKWSIYTSEAY